MISRFLLFSKTAGAVSCTRESKAETVTKYQHIFVGFVTDAYYSPEGPPGTIFGNLRLIETLKGDPHLITKVQKSLKADEGATIGGTSDEFPVGQNLIVFSNGEIPRIGKCFPTSRIDYVNGRTCKLQEYREALGIDHPDNTECEKQKENMRKQVERIRKEMAHDDA
ncbi:MAG: hypothetical protein NXI26_24975 [bacterium]|nr:hypothetical protein [bacterium]